VVKAITAARAVLDEGRTISSAVARKELDPTHLAELQLLSAKPFIYVFNVDEGHSTTPNSPPRSWRWWTPPLLLC